MPAQRAADLDELLSFQLLGSLADPVAAVQSVRLPLALMSFLWLFATAARLALLPFGWACAAQSGAHGCGRVTREVELRSSTVIAGGYPGYFRK